MAAPPPIPPNHGGDRAFIADPNKATNADAIGDIAAALQYVLHVVGELPAVAALPGVPPALVAARTGVDRARESVEGLARRDTEQREPPTLTEIPEDGFGDQPFGNTRLNHIPRFEVSKDRQPGKGEVYAWLQSCALTATAARLNDAAFYTLLLSTSSSTVATYVQGCQRRGLTIRETVRCLESRYGDLLTPDEAAFRLSMYTRPPGADAYVVLDELRTMALLQLRTQPDDVRAARVEDLVQIHFLRLMGPDVTQSLTESIRQAKSTGARIPTNDDLAAQADRLERAKKPTHEKRDRHHHVNQARERIDPSPVQHVRVVKSYQPTISELELQRAAADALDGDIEMDEVGDEIVENILAIQQTISANNQRAPTKNLISAAINHYNRKRQLNVQQITGNNAEIPQQGGPPNKLTRYETIIELLKLANVVKGECFVCGIPGHIKGSIKCALRGLPIMDMPCIRCGKGLHSADNCPKPYMKPGAVNVCEEAPLNDY